MKRSLKDMVVVITGSTGGLGVAAAKELRQQGARLALLDLSHTAASEQAQSLGGADVAKGWAADVTSLSDLETAMNAVARHFGKIDVVIANAGVGFTEPMATMTDATFTKTIDINLNGVWRTFKAAQPHVQRSKGYLLAVSSMAAFVNAPLNAHYTASKAGVLAMCNSLRLEVRPQGVAVGTLHPTFFKTPMMDALMGNACSELIFDSYRGIWKFVSLEAVVKALVNGIASRHQLITVPGNNAIMARMTGLLRPLIDRFGFSDDRIAEAIQRHQNDTHQAVANDY